MITYLLSPRLPDRLPIIAERERGGILQKNTSNAESKPRSLYKRRPFKIQILYKNEAREATNPIDMGRENGAGPLTMPRFQQYDKNEQDRRIMVRRQNISGAEPMYNLEESSDGS